MSTQRFRVLTVAGVGTLTLAAALSVAAAALPAVTWALPASTSDAYLGTIAPAAPAVRARPAGAGTVSQLLVFRQVRSLEIRRQQQLTAARAAADRSATQAVQRDAVTGPSGSPEQVAQQLLGQFGWSASQFSCLDPLWAQESGWNVTAENPSSGAYGIPQALPGSKMASAGADWATDAATQIRWGLTYIKSLYGSPCGAWAHEEADGWY
jgi:hypothetical protein